MRQDLSGCKIGETIYTPAWYQDQPHETAMIEGESPKFWKISKGRKIRKEDGMEMGSRTHWRGATFWEKVTDEIREHNLRMNLIGRLKSLNGESLKKLRTEDLRAAVIILEGDDE